jgi:hypothetical protein
LQAGAIDQQKRNQRELYLEHPRREKVLEIRQRQRYSAHEQKRDADQHGPMHIGQLGELSRSLAGLFGAQPERGSIRSDGDAAAEEHRAGANRDVAMVPARD